MASEPRRIGDYAAIGDTRTAALVARDGSIDWCCFPRFDSPAVFLRLLDDERGGFFRVSPVERHTSTRGYVPGTNVLETTFRSPSGATRLIDFMPWSGDGARDSAHAIVRVVEAAGEGVELEIVWAPTFDYARGSSIPRPFDGGIVAAGSSGALAVTVPPGFRADRGGVVRGRLRLPAGTRSALVSAFAPTAAAAIEAARSIDVDASLTRTISAWRAWCAGCVYGGRYPDAVRRSALVLKLLTYAPTGAVVASPTTSLPEVLGGARNWDYRYAWLRDSALMLRALMALDRHDESLRFFNWLESLCIACGCEAPVRIAYAVDGSPVPEEREMPHLAGFDGARPVRIGNAAVDQVQLDVFGEVLDAAWTCHSAMGWRRPNLWAVLAQLANHAAYRWREPDAGIWEMRRSPDHHVGSKVLCWVALDRAMRLARSAGVAGNVELWNRERAAVRAAILRDGFNPQLGAFVQTFGGRALDASALRIPLLGFLPATDPRIVSTVSRIRERLCDDGLVRRYLGDDGLPPGEGAFALCTLWLVHVLAEMGRVDEARSHLDRVLASANDVGLLAEEIDPSTGALLGNFPQGFTHLGLIDAILRLEAAERSPR